MKRHKKKIQLKPTTQKVLLLLMGGLALSLSASPTQYFKIIGDIAKSWEDINKRALHGAIKSLYRSKLVDVKDNEDGSVTMILTGKGKNYALRYDIESIKIPQMKKWDKKWRGILFDVPEKHKKSRDGLSFALKKIGFYKFQKSVFVYPFECGAEVDFIIEFFTLHPYVRSMLADRIDNELDIKRHFGFS